MALHTTFFPGPSQLWPETGAWLQQAVASGILSASHRGTDFVALSKGTVEQIHRVLSLPEEYVVLFTTSATESWEIIPQSLTREASYHLYSGSFGEKWYQYAQKLKPASVGHFLEVNDALPLPLPGIGPEHEIICLTHNETSNGTALGHDYLNAVRASYADKLIAIDITSSMNGVSLPWSAADIWYGSVQKCFGMPAGLGLLIVGPAAVARAHELKEKSHYNSLLTLLGHREKYQTTCTPNVLGIYLLHEVLKSLKPVAEREAALKARAAELYAALDAHSSLAALVQNAENRSHTVVTITCQAELMASLKKQALEHGFALGNGYGNWKEIIYIHTYVHRHRSSQYGPL